MKLCDYTQILQLSSESSNYEEFYIKTTLAGYNIDNVKYDFVQQTYFFIVNMQFSEFNDIYSLTNFIVHEMSKDDEVCRFMSSTKFLANVLNYINDRYASDTYSLDTEADVNLYGDSKNYCKIRDACLAKLFMKTFSCNKELKLSCDNEGNNLLLLLLKTYNIMDKIFYILNFYEPRLKGQDTYYKIIERILGDTARALMSLGVDPMQKNSKDRSFAEILGPYYKMMLEYKTRKSDTYDYV